MGVSKVLCLQKKLFFQMIPLGKNKFVTVREFRGKTLIDIREYFEKDGQLLPGKKGISLSREQYTDLKKMLSEIDEKINAM